MQIDYHSELNQQQYKAVKHMKGPALVIAGAGSGKTRVLTYRVAYLVEKKVKPKNILLLTFTRKASREMMERATNILDDRCKEIQGGTFHSFANKQLQRFFKRVGYPRKYIILTPSNARSVIGLFRLKHHPKKLHDGVKFPTNGSLINIISKSINNNLSIKDIVSEYWESYIPYVKYINKIKKSYESYKKEQGLMDYDDIILLFLQLLEEDKEVRAKLSKKYKYIMVDEYQDVNWIQAKIVKLLSSKHSNVMVVGDDSQSIYAFRGADYKNILNFPDNYDEVTYIPLEENYRSTPQILALANKVTDSLTNKFDKNLFTKSPDFSKPEVYRVDNKTDQCGIIVDEIKRIKGSGVKLDKIAVLFRASHHSNELELSLKKNGFKFVKFGGSQFIEASHVRNFISLMSVSTNIYDIVAWGNVLRLFPGVGFKTADGASRSLVEEGRYKILLDYESKSYGDDFKELFQLMGKVNDVSGVVKKIKVLIKYYRNHLRNFDDYDKKLKDVETFLNLAPNYTSMKKLLDDLTLDLADEKEIEEDKLVLSTIHSAKGLEWNSVFILNVTEGDFPSYYAEGDAEQSEEEKRLFYVAITRAERELFLFSPLSQKEHEILSSINQGLTGDKKVKRYSSSLLNDLKKANKVVKYKDKSTVNRNARKISSNGLNTEDEADDVFKGRYYSLL